MSPGSRQGKVKPSEVAADTKRNFIPMVHAHYAEMFPPYSILYCQPAELVIPRRKLSVGPPVVRIEEGDPVMTAISYAASESQVAEAVGGSRVRIPFICAANERRPGGDWETACSGYEEKLCRRSNLSATLGSPWPSTQQVSNYPIPSTGVILSDAVVVGRGPHERYERLECWHDLPVVSVPPTRWPKLKENGSMYSFAEERGMMREKIRGALRVCLYNNYDRVVVGDFGLGNSCRNPPQEVAEIWRELLLFDPELRGQFTYVVFVFDNPSQSTTSLIWEDITRKEKRGGASKPKRSGDASVAIESRGPGSAAPIDMAIYQRVFEDTEIHRLLGERDPRYGLDMITS